MKNILFTTGLALSLVLVSTTTIKAENNSAIVIQDQNEKSAKKEIQFSEAPVPVQRAFTVESVNTDAIIGAYEVTDGENTYYKVKFSKDGKTWVTKYSADGNLIERKEKTEK